MLYSSKCCSNVSVWEVIPHEMPCEWALVVKSQKLGNYMWYVYFRLRERERGIPWGTERNSLRDREEFPEGQRGIPWGTERNSLRDREEFHERQRESATSTCFHNIATLAVSDTWQTEHEETLPVDDRGWYSILVSTNTVNITILLYFIGTEP